MYLTEAPGGNVQERSLDLTQTTDYQTEHPDESILKSLQFNRKVVTVAKIVMGRSGTSGGACSQLTGVRGQPQGRNVIKVCQTSGRGGAQMPKLLSPSVNNSSLILQATLSSRFRQTVKWREMLSKSPSDSKYFHMPDLVKAGLDPEEQVEVIGDFREPRNPLLFDTQYCNNTASFLT